MFKKISSRRTAFCFVLFCALALCIIFAIRDLVFYQNQNDVSVNSILKWSLHPSEAYDAITFVTAVNTSNSSYPGLRETWSDKLVDDGIYDVDAAFDIIPMSRLANIFSYTNIQTLDDVIDRLRNFSTYKTSILTTLKNNNSPNHMFTDVETIEQYQTILLNCFEKLKQAQFDQYWKDNIEQKELKAISKLKLSKYNLDYIHTNISQFLKTDRIPAGVNVYLTYYNEPLSFMIFNSMVTGYKISSLSLVKVSIHESLHSFPIADTVIANLDKQLDSDAAKEQYNRQNYGSGKEEYFVLAAEAYLCEKSGYFSYYDCSEYLENHNGGMPFSLRIYQLLRKEKPDLQNGWQGYGPWLIERMQEGKLQFLD